MKHVYNWLISFLNMISILNKKTISLNKKIKTPNQLSLNLNPLPITQILDLKNQKISKFRVPHGFQFEISIQLLDLQVTAIQKQEIP
jgi:hypothetical protein